MNATELYRGRTAEEAVQAVGAEFRDDPADAKRRTFLFELLCSPASTTARRSSSTSWPRRDPRRRWGPCSIAPPCRRNASARRCSERKNFPETAPDEPLPWRGRSTESRSNRSRTPIRGIGARLEVFAAGNYILGPFAHIASIQISPPKPLRDLLWIPAVVRLGPGIQGQGPGARAAAGAGSVLAVQHSDEAVRLGRQTVWVRRTAKTFPFGQKTASRGRRGVSRCSK